MSPHSAPVRAQHVVTTCGHEGGYGSSWPWFHRNGGSSRTDRILSAPLVRALPRVAAAPPPPLLPRRQRRPPFPFARTILPRNIMTSPSARITGRAALHSPTRTEVPHGLRADMHHGPAQRWHVSAQAVPAAVASRRPSRRPRSEKGRLRVADSDHPDDEGATPSPPCSESATRRP